MLSCNTSILGRSETPARFVFLVPRTWDHWRAHGVVHLFRGSFSPFTCPPLFQNAVNLHDAGALYPPPSTTSGIQIEDIEINGRNMFARRSLGSAYIHAFSSLLLAFLQGPFVRKEIGRVFFVEGPFLVAGYSTWSPQNPPRNSSMTLALGTLHVGHVGLVF